MANAADYQAPVIKYSWMAWAAILAYGEDHRCPAGDNALFRGLHAGLIDHHHPALRGLEVRGGFGGEDRQQFSQANDVQVLAGTCPVTKASGKFRRVQFRTGCDREWRSICQLWAKALLLGGASDLASTYFARMLEANPSTSHAYRCLANRWMAIAWKLWQTGKPYYESLSSLALAMAWVRLPTSSLP